MERENEILGTAFVLIFDALIAFFVYVLCKSGLPAFLPILIGIAAGCLAIWATYKIAKYWIRRFGKSEKEETT
jgi:xanthine/uracil permease